ncbi:ribosomal protein PSRP-3/Ycf65 [Actinidia rufa]|uniref:Ribosomal protein PSRP-3/Ycf65 n=1 Tax=Actinidia rufa TaxID=165716 RepID=A0A7J0FD74_9ERIC|nr:ribosomal protein PSRP-3/Ycf65 [Actinidia rufa]
MNFVKCQLLSLQSVDYLNNASRTVKKTPPGPGAKQVEEVKIEEVKIEAQPMVSQVVKLGPEREPEVEPETTLKANGHVSMKSLLLDWLDVLVLLCMAEEDDVKESGERLDMEDNEHEFQLSLKLCVCLILGAWSSLNFVSLEAWSVGEADAETKVRIEVHLDGEEHWSRTRPNDSRPWDDFL